MGGHPLWRLVLTVACLLLLLPLVVQLTGREAAPLPLAAADKPAQNEAVSLPVEITFSQPVQRFSVRYSGQELWSGEAAHGTLRRALPIPFPAQGIDLAIQAEWAENGADESAVRVTVTPPNHPAITQTAWARGKLDEVLTFTEAAR